MNTNPIIVPVVNVIELGVATTLTLGMGPLNNEGTGGAHRPYTL